MFGHNVFWYIFGLVTMNLAICSGKPIIFGNWSSWQLVYFAISLDREFSFHNDICIVRMLRSQLNSPSHLTLLRSKVRMTNSDVCSVSIHRTAMSPYGFVSFMLVGQYCSHLRLPFSTKFVTMTMRREFSCQTIRHMSWMVHLLQPCAAM